MNKRLKMFTTTSKAISRRGCRVSIVPSVCSSGLLETTMGTATSNLLGIIPPAIGHKKGIVLPNENIN